MEEDILEYSSKTDTVDEYLYRTLKDYSEYNSMGTLNLVIRCLNAIKERIQSGQRIYFTGDGDYLNEFSFRRFVVGTFSSYIYNQVYPKDQRYEDCYFKLNNTEEGLELVYTGQKENRLFHNIAKISDQYSLVALIPTNVVYIHDMEVGTYSLFQSEHNSCYVYDFNKGKILEHFDK